LLNYRSTGAHNEFEDGKTYTDSVTVKSEDGTSKVVTVTMTGTNDAAVISGTSTASVTETNVVMKAAGTLSATDVDSASTFIARSNVVGSNGFGKFSIGTNGVWYYTTNTAHNEFVAGKSYTDSFTAKSADGSEQVVTVTMIGSDDATVISGTSSVTVAETDVSITTGGKLVATDADSSALFIEQVETAGTKGTFTIGTNGVWSYSAYSAYDNLKAGQTITDTFTVKTEDGTSKIVAVKIIGTNDAAVITGTSSADVIETDTIVTAGGTLYVTDVDSSASFVARNNVAGSNGYGVFTVSTNGVWTYKANSAHNEFHKDADYTDSFTVKSVDGTEQVVTVTINGTNDAALITGTSSVSVDETNEAITQGGTLISTDADNTSDFAAQSDVAGAHGKFSIEANGVWSYKADAANDALNEGEKLTDSFTVKSVDGTEQVVTVTINGTNDAALITGTSSVSVDETNAVITTGGTLHVMDVDSPENFIAQSGVAGTAGFGIFSIGSGGEWVYTTNNAHNEFVAGQSYIDSYTATSADGTPKVLTVTIVGTDDPSMISGQSSAIVAETDSPIKVGGELHATNIDNKEVFFEARSEGGSYGKFSIDESGVWNYRAGSAYDELKEGQSYVDSFKVRTEDGASKVITVTILGTDECHDHDAHNTFSIIGTENDEIVIGSGWNDSIHGGLGNDILTGGAGADNFVFDTAVGRENVDMITDFSHKEDTMYLSAKFFAELKSNGVLGASEFWTGSSAHDEDDRIIYDAKTGNLFYDADGKGGDDAVQIAKLIGIPDIDHTDFRLME